MGHLDAFRSKEKAQSAVSPLKDPFAVEFIKHIGINIYPGRRFGKPISAYVEFENGNTEGQQNFEGDDLQTVVTEVQAFIDHLQAGVSG